ncbi:MAG: PEP-CTERM sorting domain-containing protein [Acidimicrobiia bacterium]|nr:PEP-CTERM sorting domain-containing protein [Acidimicrobiia bacterium]
MAGKRIGVLGLAGLLATASPAWADPLVITSSVDAVAMVSALVAGNPGIAVVAGSQRFNGVAGNSTDGDLTGDHLSSGTFTGGTGILPFDSGVILTSGAAASAPGPNSADGTTTAWGLPGDPDLNTLTTGTTFDAAVLEFDFIPTNNVISFQYVFASEEYNEFVGSIFNDVFGFFLNGVNIALVPFTLSPVTINNVNCASNPAYYTDLDASSNGGPECLSPARNIEYDGLVGATAPFVLYAQGFVTPNVINTIKLAVADTGDFQLDSAVFLRAGSFDDEQAPPAIPEPGTLILLGSGLAVAARRRLAERFGRRRG